MTATEELRQMLDKRGVEWDVLQGSEGGEMTRWRDSMGRYVTAYDDGVVAFFTDFYWGPTPQQAIEATLGPAVPPPPAPDQPPYDVLLDILASEWGIEASWDGLRRFWCVELNDEGVLKREELQAENAKLRELAADMYACIEALCSMVENSPGCSMCPTNQDEEKPCAAADVYCRMCKLGVEVK